jgi:hypothetical protein
VVFAQSSIVSISALFDRLPRPNFEDNVAGTQQFFTELNRLGITGVVDPGGFSIYPSHYAALQKLWREKSLSVRVAFSLFAQNVGAEFEEYKNLTQFLPMGFGDDMLRFNGLGERITAAMNNNPRPTDAEKAKYYEIVKWAADRGMALTMHWNNDASVGQLLDIFERVNKDVPIAPLRWSIAHLNDASAATLTIGLRVVRGVGRSRGSTIGWARSGFLARRRSGTHCARGGTGRAEVALRLQWRKWRTPVSTIVAPASSAAAITSLSRSEPPGWAKAVTPAARQTSTPSGNG